MIIVKFEICSIFFDLKCNENLKKKGKNPDISFTYAISLGSQKVRCPQSQLGDSANPTPSRLIPRHIGQPVQRPLQDVSRRHFVHDLGPFGP